MNRILKRFTLASAMALAAPSFANVQVPTHLTAQEKLAELDRQVPLMLATYDVPSVGIAYIENGEIAFVRHYGFQSWGFPANEETLYNVASLTKPITAEVVLRLIDAGEVSLDTRLADHHMEEDVEGDPRTALLTPEVVMRHRTGFLNWRYKTGGVLQFTHDPDTVTEYSGEGYEWMLQGVAAATGRDFEEAADSLVFEPIGMPLTGYTLSGKWAGHLASPYKAGEAVYNMIHRQPVASDDLRTTAREYARFMIDVWEGDAVSPELRRQQRTVKHYLTYKPACKGREKAAFCPVNEGWGMGWGVHEWSDRTIVEHSGGDIGEKSFAFYDPEAKRGAVILTNGANGHEILNRLSGLLDGDQRFADYMMSPY